MEKNRQKFGFFKCSHANFDTLMFQIRFEMKPKVRYSMTFSFVNIWIGDDFYSTNSMDYVESWKENNIGGMKAISIKKSVRNTLHKFPSIYLSDRLDYK